MNMEQPIVTHSTFVVERSYAATPERVFAAFADPARKRKWYAESAGRDVVEFTSDFRVGGSERTVSKFKEGTPFPGATLAAESVYQDIVENRRIVFAYTMSMEGRRFSASLSTIELLPTANGTDLVFTDQSAFFEGADGAQMREAGWRKLLENLGNELGQ
jgi:uncharacterized protein YndB with AHSA1/START domain